MSDSEALKGEVAESYEELEEISDEEIIEVNTEIPSINSLTNTNRKFREILSKIDVDDEYREREETERQRREEREQDKYDEKKFQDEQLGIERKKLELQKLRLKKEEEEAKRKAEEEAKRKAEEEAKRKEEDQKGLNTSKFGVSIDGVPYESDKLLGKINTLKQAESY